jgi:hypothetical protein
MTRRRRFGPRLAAGCALLAGLAAGCAPHRVAPPRLDTTSVERRHARALEARRDMGRALDAEARVWIGGRAFGDLPAVTALLALGGPDACRVRVRSLFGTALDLAARGDSLEGFVPARRVALRLPGVAESLGVREPGALVVRVWSAGWAPPREAWERAAWRDSLLELRWLEHGDSLSLAVGSSGLPAEARLARPEGPAVRALYRRWEPVEGVAWPARVDFEDEAGTVRVECRVDRARRDRPDPGRVRPRIPADAEVLGWADLRRAIARLGSL